jgi:hypothetical protein
MIYDLTERLWAIFGLLPNVRSTREGAGCVEILGHGIKYNFRRTFKVPEGRSYRVAVLWSAPSVEDLLHDYPALKPWVYKCSRPKDNRQAQRYLLILPRETRP